MATIKWRQDNCRIIKLEVGDIYTDEEGCTRIILVKQYLLLAGQVDLRFKERNEKSDHVWVSIPNDIKPENKPTILHAYEPDPCEWWGVICKSIDLRTDIPEIEEIENAVDKPRKPIIDEPMFTLKDLLLTGLTIGLAVFGITR